MGCFLGCFGVSTKRKRRKPANRILPGPADSRFVSYEPLDSTDVDFLEDSLVSKSQLSNKPKERSSVKIRKKVSFNLNVQTYEPIPDEETTTFRFLQSVEEEENGGEAGKGSLPFSSDGVSSSLQTSVYPCNYRYQNCRDSYDEDDEVVYEESDLEDDDDYFDDDDDYKDVDDKFESPNMVSTKGDDLIQLEDDKSTNEMSLRDSTDGNARIRSQYLCSVLNPVENTNQWKEIKARAAVNPRQTRKENVAVEEESQLPFTPNPRSNCSPNYNQSKSLLQDISVDASLSNWLISPNIDTLQSKKSISDGSFSRRSREDRVILDITNL
ncbi:hypothetical protein like AT2G33400 [Hibiscus trionum]|uniref:Uncharacterized protein n=1 Tax=Hibiscus trionum TaxID=183268 RepID=A0A9W7LMY8_HIBTR|nr:hypothetical protein like AT2G33400 [Hibiscus trionum]